MFFLVILFQFVLGKTFFFKLMNKVYSTFKCDHNALGLK